MTNIIETNENSKEKKLQASFEYFRLDSSNGIKDARQAWKTKVPECHPDILRGKAAHNAKQQIA